MTAPTGHPSPLLRHKLTVSNALTTVLGSYCCVTTAFMSRAPEGNVTPMPPKTTPSKHTIQMKNKLLILAQLAHRIHKLQWEHSASARVVCVFKSHQSRAATTRDQSVLSFVQRIYAHEG